MAAFWEAFLTVLVVELTDRTRIIALLLSARFRAPVALIAGMTAGYLFPLGLAAYGAGWIVGVFPPQLLRGVVGLSFLGFGVWLLRDADGEERGEGKMPSRWERWERLGPLLLGFLLVTITEFADKSQIATAILATRLRPISAVFAGAVSAQAVLNVLYVLLGQWLGRRVPAALIRRIAGWSFIVLGAASFLVG